MSEVFAVAQPDRHSIANARAAESSLVVAEDIIEIDQRDALLRQHLADEIAPRHFLFDAIKNRLAVLRLQKTKALSQLDRLGAARRDIVESDLAS